MLVVHFPEEFLIRAPGSMGRLCAAPENKWVTMFDVIDALGRGETVLIRQASAAELKRAEGFTALYEIGVMLGQKVSSLLDQETPEERENKLIRLYRELSSLGPVLPSLLDADAGLPNAAAYAASAGS